MQSITTNTMSPQQLKSILHSAEIMLTKACGQKIICFAPESSEINSISFAEYNKYLEKALDIVSKYTGVLRELILIKSRQKSIMNARQIVTYMLYLKGITYPQIALLLGKERSTSYHSVEIVQSRMSIDKEFTTLIKNISYEMDKK